MGNNPYIPQDIPLLTNATLQRTLDSYRDLLQVLPEEDAGPVVRQMRDDVSEALRLVEAELRARRRDNAA